MKVGLSSQASKDIDFWRSTNPKILEKINELIDSIKVDPFKGVGKPEPLKGDFQGFWSRRITKEHRLIYSVNGTDPNKILLILSARTHYYR